MITLKRTLVLTSAVVGTFFAGSLPVMGHLCQFSDPGTHVGGTTTYSIFGSVDATYRVTDFGDTNIVSVTPATLGAMSTGVFDIKGLKKGSTEISIFWKGVVEAGDDDEGTCTFTVYVTEFPLPNSYLSVFRRPAPVIPVPDPATARYFGGFTETQPVPPGQSGYLNQNFRNLPLDYKGSAVITAEEMLCLVNVPSKNGFRSYPGVCDSDPTLFIPAVKNNFFGASSTFHIQNVGDSSANVRITYSDGSTDFSNVPPGETELLDVGSSGLPPGFFGSAQCTSDGPPIAVVNRETDGSGCETVVAGSPPDGDRFFVPTLIHSPSLIRSFQVIDTSGSPNSGTITYYNRDGTVRSTTPSFPVNNATFIDPALHSLPPGFDGSAIFDSTLPVVFTGIDQEGTAPPSYYEGVKPGSNTATFPLVQHQFQNFHSVLDIQNASGSSAAITVDFNGRDIQGRPVSETENVNLLPRASMKMDTSLNALFPDGFQGSARIESSQTDLAATVRIETKGSACTYSGLPDSYTAPRCYAPYVTGNTVPLEVAPPVILEDTIDLNWTNLGPGYFYSLELAPLGSDVFTPVPPFDTQGPGEDTSYSGPLPGEGGVFRIRTVDAGP